MTSIAEPPRTLGLPAVARVVGALALGAGLIALASSDLPSPLPWAYGLLPIGIYGLARKVGLLLGALAAASTLGAVYAAGLKDNAPLLFVAVLLTAGLLLAVSARRGLRASVALTLAVTPVLLVAAGYLLAGGLDDLTRQLAARLDELRRVESEHRLSQSMGLSAAEFEQALNQTAALWRLLLPSLFAIKWVLVIAVNCWLASVLFEEEGGFPSFARFVTWRMHPAGAWALAVALALMAARVRPAFEAGVNLAFPLALAYTLQGFAVARFVAIALQVRGLVQGAVVVLLVLMPILVVGITAIGVLDAWYDFRTRVTSGTQPSRSGDDGSGDWM